MITPSVCQFTFMRADNLPLVFIPGQFITFLLPHESGKTVRRHYSLANDPERCCELEIAVAPIPEGFATKILFNLKIGDELLCVGPKGRLILQEEEKTTHYILVATGTGVAPYRSMLSVISRRLKDENLKVTLLLGVRYVEDLLYVEDFVAFAKAHNRFDFRSYLSRANALSEPYQYSGYVQSFFETFPLNPVTDLVYLCGNPYMIDETSEKLQKLDFDLQRIRREKYISARVI